MAISSLALSALQNLVVSVNNLNEAFKGYFSNPPGTVLITSYTGSGQTTIDDTTSFSKSFFGTGTFRSFVFGFENVLFSANDQLACRVHANGAFQTTNYLGPNATMIVLSGQAASTGGGVSGHAYFYSPMVNNLVSALEGQTVADDRKGNLNILQCYGAWNVMTPIDGIQFFAQNGSTIMGGRIAILGGGGGGDLIGGVSRQARR
jgi:hypothetical protein